MEILFGFIRFIYLLIGILAIVNITRLRKKTKCEGDCYKGAIMAVMVCFLGIFSPEYTTTFLILLGVLNKFKFTKKAKTKGATTNVKERKIKVIHGRKKERQKKQA